MRELTIPDDVYERLKAAARRHGRSVDDHVRVILEYVIPPREEEIRRLRKAMSDSLESTDTDALPAEIRPRETPIDHAALRASMPNLDPPLSTTIINDRSDRV
jgi:plasmid stability protein